MKRRILPMITWLTHGRFRGQGFEVRSSGFGETDSEHQPPNSSLRTANPELRTSIPGGAMDRAQTVSTEQFAGCILGLACGDALGATLEFLSRDEVRMRYGQLREIIGGGWLRL